MPAISYWSVPRIAFRKEPYSKTLAAHEHSVMEGLSTSVITSSCPRVLCNITSISCNPEASSENGLPILLGWRVRTQGKVIGVAGLLGLFLPNKHFLSSKKRINSLSRILTRTGRLNGIADQRLTPNCSLNQSAGYESALSHPSRNCFCTFNRALPAGSCIAVSTCACAKVRQKHDMYFANCLQHSVHPLQLVCTTYARLTC